MKICQFINTEIGFDFIISYAYGDLEDIKSIILQRTPEFEFALYPEERGVHFSSEDETDKDEYNDELNMLKEVMITGREVRLIGSKYNIEIDCFNVDEDEWKESLVVFKKMNFDDVFKFTVK